MRKILSLKNQALIADKCSVADSFVSRLVGLMGRKGMDSGEALWFPRCRSIHMMFMRMSIDVVFVRQTGAGLFEVTSLHSGVRPWRLLPLNDWKADDAIELPEGCIRRQGLQTGEVLCLS